MRSFWMRQALQAESGEQGCPALKGNGEAEVLIVGGGFTGLWTAIELKERSPNLDVMVIERDICGAGASGSNGGVALALWPHGPKFAAMYGEDVAANVCRIGDEMIDGIRRFSELNGIDSEVSKPGLIWGATCDRQAGFWAGVVEFSRRYDHTRYKLLSGTEIENEVGSHVYVAGAVDTKAVFLHPGKLVRGLRRIALERGVRIHENTAMVSLARSVPPRVKTLGGTITAKKVVLATYAWSIGLPELRSSVMVIGSDAVVTQPVEGPLQRIKWNGYAGITDSRNFVRSTRRVGGDRVMLCRGGTWIPFGAEIDKWVRKGSGKSVQELKYILGEFYPELAEAPIDTAWSCPIDRSMSGIPMFGSLPTCKDIFYGFGYSGAGLVLTQIGGKILSSLVLNSDDRWSRMPFVRSLERSFPPEPFRYVGAHLVAQAIERKDKLDHLGRATGPITNYFLKFRPGSYKPT
ncbi:FAD-dependent oxidoreductase [Mesorhizobium sp. M4B.F.Ca.ET.190.01.1.1]|uniref:NAD(P)/FAD-dependent oxidoreductase n=1 Tax=unclassified Mesorhizobium TaxID=325217 RepID=UPI0010932698|nr:MULTISPECIES: FAD-binding oxidoreductase [unclassified Mesorhizobium]TGR10530.1 FAD-dependent oxidoreductase [Mesorhizobium sp. M4B.F.Ca.ET.200.01.1.1]TGS19620.1 FAD-dependent oxidoreductase [Mesorhizobium sp. M4B.F.Ca.ET.190.01.1.1]TGT32414.1 FAD-dependent oxidoreductase [Mesorhizobium sp. M4B.F.Ca.ET.172.01.1.1]